MHEQIRLISKQLWKFFNSHSSRTFESRAAESRFLTLASQSSGLVEDFRKALLLLDRTPTLALLVLNDQDRKLCAEILRKVSV